MYSTKKKILLIIGIVLLVFNAVFVAFTGVRLGIKVIQSLKSLTADIIKKIAEHKCSAKDIV